MSWLRRCVVLGAIALCAGVSLSQTPLPRRNSPPMTRDREVQLGSKTARGGFQNENEIRDKFNNWHQDSEAQHWLESMGYPLLEIQDVKAVKPHGEKADVELIIKTKSGEHSEGISIKLVSNPDGFNQIDKRWLKNYSQMWNMPIEVHKALQLFVGEAKPTKPGRDLRRMFLDELDPLTQKLVLEFFESHRERIVSDLFAGQGEHAANWIMVTLKTNSESGNNQDANSNSGGEFARSNKTKSKGNDDRASVNHPLPEYQSILVATDKAAKFFGNGAIEITKAGSLRMGRITVQRKGGDNGRASANMLQFKINPVELFELNKAN